MKSSNKKTIIWISLFAIAMGFLETSVVVYLRKLYYPIGFNFPLAPVESTIAVTEFWREIATIIMLIGAGIMAGKNKSEKFAYFLYAFAIWDLFYYIFLKVILNWPNSLMTWDILFLVPVPWVGPVIAPCIIACLMIVLAGCILNKSFKNIEATLDLKNWLLLITGSIVCIYAFCLDYIDYANSKGFMWSLTSDTSMFKEVENYVPKHFHWGLFSLGLFFIVGGIITYAFQKTKSLHIKTNNTLKNAA